MPAATYGLQPTYEEFVDQNQEFWEIPFLPVGGWRSIINTQLQYSCRYFPSFCLYAINSEARNIGSHVKPSGGMPNKISFSRHKRRESNKKNEKQVVNNEIIRK